MKRALAAAVLCASMSALAQESLLQADFRGEGTRFSDNCASFATFASCAQTLFTDHPLHIALGSLAPQNGFGAGLAFVSHLTTTNWRHSWDVDAVASSNASWRAGAYMTSVWTPKHEIVVTPGGSAPASEGPKRERIRPGEQLVFHLYAESTSLNQLLFYGLGPASQESSRSYYGMTESIAGANVVWPIVQRLNLSFYGEANGRFTSLREAGGSGSIGEMFPPTAAPGLGAQPAFFQLGQGIRLRPTMAHGFVQLNYRAAFQEFVAPNSTFSFNRFTADMDHRFPLYRASRPAEPRDFNGPDECSASVADPRRACPPLVPAAPPGASRNLEGSFGLRLLLVDSLVPSGHVVPFFFQPTLGGSDINGNPLLASYPDYRFRAPNLLLLRASFEHSIWGPFGASLMLDEGKVGLKPSDLDFTHLAHTYSAGLTLRAGGFPLVYLLFCWGGHEGTHTIASMNSSLLGGSPRPSLY